MVKYGESTFDIPCLLIIPFWQAAAKDAPRGG